jgi:hypothetical protein
MKKAAIMPLTGGFIMSKRTEHRQLFKLVDLGKTATAAASTNDMLCTTTPNYRQSEAAPVSSTTQSPVRAVPCRRIAGKRTEPNASIFQKSATPKTEATRQNTRTISASRASAETRQS